MATVSKAKLHKIVQDFAKAQGDTGSVEEIEWLSGKEGNHYAFSIESSDLYHAFNYFGRSMRRDDEVRQALQAKLTPLGLFFEMQNSCVVAIYDA